MYLRSRTHHKWMARCCLPVVLVILLGLTVMPAQAQDSPITATVRVAALNVRSGPGTDYAKVGMTAGGDVLEVVGNTSACGWLYVSTPGGLEGWVSGIPQYVQLNALCSDIPEVQDTPADEDVPTPTPLPSVASGIPADQGCIDFGAWAGPDLMISGSRWNSDPARIMELKVANNTVSRVCLEPGRWGITVSAIARFWSDYRFDVDINAGDLIDMPLVRVQ